MRVRAYCEFEFLDELSRELAGQSAISRFISDDTNEQLYLLAEFALKRCDLHLDDLIAFQKLASTNPFYKAILKKSLTGASTISSANQTHSEDALPLPVVRLISDHTGKALSSTSPCLTLSMSIHRSNIRYLNFTRSCQVDPSSDLNEFDGWREFLQDLPPVRTVVIADQYLYDKSVKPNHNIKAILKAVLQQAEDQFPVNVILMINEDLRGRRKRVANGLQKYISDVFPKLAGRIRVQTVRKQKFHDRFILLDYALVTSGHSLDYYNTAGDLNKSTTLQISGSGSTTGQTYFAMHRKVNQSLSKGKDNWDTAEANF